MPITNINVQQISASNQTFTGSVRITGGANITVGTDASGVSIVGAAAAGGGVAVAATDTTYTSGTVNISGENRITVHSSTAGGGVQNVLISGPAAQTGISGLVGSNATYTSGTVTITGVGGGITVSSNTGQRIDLSVAAQTAQTGISGIVASDSTYTSGTVQISGENNITVHSSTAAAGVQKVLISGPNTSAQQTGISSIAVSNTTYTSGMVVFTGSNMITAKSSGAGQTVIIDATQSAQTQSNIQGIAGSNTTYNTGTVEFTGSNMITVKSSANQRLVIDATQTGTQFSAGISGGNTSGNSGTVAGQVVFAGGNNITLSGSTNGASETITISAGAAGGGATISGLVPFQGSYTIGAINQNTLGLAPFVVPQQLEIDRAINYVRVSLSTSTNSSHAMAVDLRVGIFTKNASTLSLSVSGSAAHSWSNTSNNSVGSVTGLRIMTVPLTASLTPGVYFLGVLSSTRTTNTNWGSASQLLITQSAWSLFGGIGQNSNIASIQFVPGLGIGSVSTAAMPNSLAFSDIEGYGGANERYAKIPVVNFTSGTV